MLLDTLAHTMADFKRSSLPAAGLPAPTSQAPPREFGCFLRYRACWFCSISSPPHQHTSLSVVGMILAAVFFVIHMCDLNTRIKIIKWALTGVARWVEYQPANWKVTSSNPDQTHAWAADLVPGWGAYEKQLIYVSVPCRCSSPSLSPSLVLAVKIK